MLKLRFRILATGVALAALIASTEASLAFHGGGGGGGGGHMGGGGFGGGFHGMSGGGLGGFHGMGGGGFHGMAAGGLHGLSAHGFSAHGLSAHGLSARNFGHHSYALSHHGVGHFAGHQYTGRSYASRGGHAGQLAAHHGVVSSHNTSAAHNNRLTHNQLAAANFHGLHNFSRTGFNRNGFGNEHAWNRWCRHFWAAGWNNWGWGWGAWAGPVFWPFLWGDVFSFAFWPYDYYDPFWAYGPDFLFAGVFAPGPYFGPELGYAPDYYGYNEGYPDFIYAYAGNNRGRHPPTRPVAEDAGRAQHEALVETNAAAVGSCSSLAPEVTSLPLDQIRRTIHPTADQDAALDDLSSAAAKANDIIKASCPTDTPLTPIGRLDAAQKRLGAMVQAVETVRSPLARLYDTLNDDQKTRFNTMSGSGRAGPTSGDLATLCRPRSGEVVQLPIQRIEQLIQPNAQQQGAFNDLKAASQTAADALQTSCPSQFPGTPVGRLDAVKGRLSAMIDSLQTVRPKLAAFYALLSDEQKAKFNTMGPAPQSANPQGQSQGGG